MSDATTTLNAGSGGDVLDETLVTQSDGVTAAKRPRVQIGGSTGTALADVVSADPGKNPGALVALQAAVVDESVSAFVDGEVRRLSLSTEGRLRVVAAQPMNDLDFFGSAPSGTDRSDFKFCPPNDPFGF